MDAHSNEAVYIRIEKAVQFYQDLKTRRETNVFSASFVAEAMLAMRALETGAEDLTKLINDRLGSCALGFLTDILLKDKEESRRYIFCLLTIRPCHGISDREYQYAKSILNCLDPIGFYSKMLPSTVIQLLDGERPLGKTDEPIKTATSSDWEAFLKFKKTFLDKEQEKTEYKMGLGSHTTEEIEKACSDRRYCQTCQKTDHLNLCGKCKKVRYCSTQCQKSDWSAHKIQCKP